MRTTCSSEVTKILPSPILPVRADASTASITRSTIASSTAASIFTLGRKSTTYSAPRYSSVWPFCRPKPLTSVTVMPCTPIALSASRTSSSLNGLTIAVTIFMSLLLRKWVSEGLAHRQHQRAAGDVLVGERGRTAREAAVGVDVARAQGPTLQVVGDAELPVGDVVVLAAVELGDACAALQAALVADVADQRELLGQRVGDGAIE